MLDQFGDIPVSREGARQGAHMLLKLAFPTDGDTWGEEFTPDVHVAIGTALASLISLGEREGNDTLNLLGQLAYDAALSALGHADAHLVMDHVVGALLRNRVEQRRQSR